MLIQLENITKSYKNKKVLDVKELTIEEGKIYGIVGKNGAGKTTLFRLLSGLSFPTSGTIDFTYPDEKFGVIIEMPAIDQNMTAEENLTWMSKVYEKEKRKDIQELLELVHLQGVDKKVKNFSLGMKQRLGIAMCLLHNPRMLILDEPMNGLDPEGMVELRNMLVDINKAGTTILISSHLLGELYKFATNYIFIKDGMIIQNKSYEEIEEISDYPYEIKTDDNQKAARLLKEELACKVKVNMSKGQLTFHPQDKDILEISKYLAKNEVYITGLTENKFDIESYYMEVIK